jgi:hypothetical protein
MVRKSIRALVASGLSIDEVDEILNELEGWLAWTEHPSPDLFEGPEGWYRTFLTFVIEGDAGKTCPSRILRKQRWRPKPGAVDLDHPDTWKKRPQPPKA